MTLKETRSAPPAFNRHLEPLAVSADHEITNEQSQSQPSFGQTSSTSKHLRNLFLGLLKIRYATGDRSVVNYKDKKNRSGKSADSDENSWSRFVSRDTI